MDAIILAAGRGQRLADFNPDGRPKCLLEFGGRSLLARELADLAALGVARVELVVGYEADRVIEHVGRLDRRPEVTFTYNPRYRDGSVLSLRLARDTLTAAGDFLLLDADVLYVRGILERLVSSEHRNVFLLDRHFTPGDEPVKIALREGRMVEFRKALAPELAYDTLGESVGFFRFDGAMGAEIERACAAYEAEGLADAPHEEVLRDLLLREPDRFACEDVSGLAWVEIDFPEDVERAIKEVLPAIETGQGDTG
jgi:choline kinase